MSTKAIIVTGANGEIGRGVVQALAQRKNADILALDIAFSEDVPTSPNVKRHKVDILDARALAEVTKNYTLEGVFHLAARLSSSGEKDPEKAHLVNVEGSINLLAVARTATETLKTPVKFVFPSTIAAYGLPESTPNTPVKIREDQFLMPITMYGINKLYVEHLGRYYTNNYRMFEGDRTRLDFRCIRLPGILCSDTVPTGGTSDYGPEMVHAAAQGKTYSCFVPPDARLPFMVKPDAVTALLSLFDAPKESIKHPVYNVTSFAPSAMEIRNEIAKYFPTSEVVFEPHPARSRIVASWPRDLDDSAARTDWGWKPAYDLTRAFKDYLVPGITARYKK